MSNTTTTPAPDNSTLIGIAFVMAAFAFLFLFVGFIHFCCHKTSCLGLLWFKWCGYRYYSRVELRELSEKVDEL